MVFGVFFNLFFITVKSFNVCVCVFECESCRLFPCVLTCLFLSCFKDKTLEKPKSGTLKSPPKGFDTTLISKTYYNVVSIMRKWGVCVAAFCAINNFSPRTSI